MGSSINARAASGNRAGASTASDASTDAGLSASGSFGAPFLAGASASSGTLLPLLSAPLLGGLLLLRPART